MKNRRIYIPLTLFLVFGLLSWISKFAFSAEHPGTSTIEHPGKAITADFVKKSIEDHVKDSGEINPWRIRGP